MIVTFCGHRKVHAPQEVAIWLNQVCEQLMIGGATTFYLGGYGAFDLLALKVLRQLKEAYPAIRLILILPYLNSRKHAEGYDDTLYPPLEQVPQRYAIIRRNEWCVRQADAVVAYVMCDWGGAAGMLRYARRKKKRLLLYFEENVANHRFVQ